MILEHWLRLDLAGKSVLYINSCVAHQHLHDNMEQYALSWLKQLVEKAWRRSGIVSLRQFRCTWVSTSTEIIFWASARNWKQPSSPLSPTKLFLLIERSKNMNWSSSYKAADPEAFNSFVVASTSRILRLENTVHSIPEFSSYLTFAGGIRLLKRS